MMKIWETRNILYIVPIYAHVYCYGHMELLNFLSYIISVLLHCFFLLVDVYVCMYVSLSN